MINIFSMFLFLLIMDGVFGVDTEDVKTVMEGDSLTLQTDFTEIQKDGLIEWECNGRLIANIIKETGEVEYSDKIMFSGRLSLDQTGFLTIRNIRMKHSGEYKVEGSSSAWTKSKIFRVIVKESPLEAVEDKDEIKTLSVTEGNPETLQTDTELQKHDLILWRFGAEGSLIAKGDTEDNITSYYDGRFRDRLKMDSKTGSLTITDIKTEHAGEYQLKIISERRVLFRRFTVTVSNPGVSSGAVAGIVLLVLLLVFLAAAAGVIFYRRKISDLERQKSAVKATEVESVSVSEGDDVTLSTDVPEIQRDDQIKWKFGGELIAEIKGETSKQYDDVLDGIFKNRLKVDQKTRSLTITNTEMKHAGVYQLKIKSGSEVSYKKFIIILRQRKIVKEGESVTLDPKTEIQSDHQLLWMFGEKLIARIKGGTVEKFDDVPGGRFRDRLELDKTTGSLTITNMRNEESGLYKLQIISIRGTTYKKFFVIVCERIISVKEKESVTLDLKPKIQTDDQILWMFEEKLIAQIKGGKGEKFDVPGGRFRDSLVLEKTGSLTITNMRIEQSGLYKLQIISSTGTTITRFFVTVNGHRKNESATVEMPLLSDVNDHLETRSL